jgi:ribosome biogenesis protein UTP30
MSFFSEPTNSFTLPKIYFFRHTPTLISSSSSIVLLSEQPITMESRVDTRLVTKAVEALLKNHQGKLSTKKSSLLGDEAFLQVQFGLDKVPHEASPKPKRIDIPHKLWSIQNSDGAIDDNGDELQEPSVCLIVKEESKPWVQELLSNLPQLNFVKKVLGLDSLRKKHAKFEQQRALLHRFDVFLADDRVLPMLAKALGKHFFETKKQPIPVRLTRATSLPLTIVKSLQSTFMYLPQGTCLTVKAGHTGMSAKHLVENVMAIANQVPLKVPKQWSNIRSIAVKTTNSMALPFYSKTPAELQELCRLAGLEPEKPVVKRLEESKRDESNPSDEKTNKERKAKSPLVKALKKQQELEKKQNETKDEEAPSKLPDMNKKKRKKHAADEPGDNSNAAAEQKDPDKKQKVTHDDSGLIKSKQKKDNKDREEKTVIKSNSIKEKKEFIASKKYSGSKPGYVFKRGTKGVGYYVDIKPVVDPILLDAITRMAQQQRGSRGSGRPKAGKRRGRR